MTLADAVRWCTHQPLPASLEAQSAEQLLAKLQLAHVLGTVCGPAGRLAPLDRIPHAEHRHVLVSRMHEMVSLEAAF